MHGAEKGLNELCGILKTAECDIKKSTGSGHVMMAVQNKPTFKKKGSSWKKKGKAKVVNPKPNPTPKAWTSCRQGVLSLSPARTLEKEFQTVPRFVEEPFFNLRYACYSCYRHISR